MAKPASRQYIADTAWRAPLSRRIPSAFRQAAGGPISVQILRRPLGVAERRPKQLLASARAVVLPHARIPLCLRPPTATELQPVRNGDSGPKGVTSVPVAASPL